MTPEEFIRDCTRGCSNELVAVEDRFGKRVISYHEWLTPDQALRAVEIAREEMKKPASAGASASEDLDLGCGVIWRSQEEPASDDMEQASRDYADNHYADFAGSEEDEENYWCSRFGFKAGANWQKQQMMKEAVDGDITFDFYGSDDMTYGCVAHDSFCLEERGLKDKDKVKLIIVKED